MSRGGQKQETPRQSCVVLGAIKEQVKAFLRAETDLFALVHQRRYLRALAEGHAADRVHEPTIRADHNLIQGHGGPEVFQRALTN